LKNTIINTRKNYNYLFEDNLLFEIAGYWILNEQNQELFPDFETVY